MSTNEEKNLNDITSEESNTSKLASEESTTVNAQTEAIHEESSNKDAVEPQQAVEETPPITAEETVSEATDEASEVSAATVEEAKDSIETEAEAEVKEEGTLEETAKESKKDPILSVIDRFAHSAADLAEEIEDEVYQYYYKLLAKAEDLVQSKDWAFISQELGIIKEKWAEGEATVSDTVKSMFAAIEELENDFKARKQAHYERLNTRKEENLVKKKALLQEMRELIENEKWNAQATVNKLKGRFENIRLVDRSELEKLEKQFNDLVETFESKKVELMVERAKKEEENLAGKLYVLDKMTQMVKGLSKEVKNWEDQYQQIQQYAKDWKKIGRVPAEKTREVYDQFHQAIDTFYEKRMEFDEDYRKRIEKALTKKKALIEEAEMLIDQEDLATSAQRVNILHRNWKKSENLPQKDENELWNRFKEATDKFNDYKQENLDKLRDQENANLQVKEDIIERAEDLLTTDDFNSGADKMQQLLEEWKKTGPVPIRKAKSSWDSFKKIMDQFYDKRRNHFKDQRKEQKSNMDRKMQILDEMRKLVDEADIDAAQQKVKELQDEFKNIGFVPIKQKNKVWKDYREVCDLVYGHFRELRKTSHKINAVVQNQAEEGESDEITKKRHKRERVRQEISRLNEDILKTRESLSYFKSDNDSNPLIMDIKKKINTAEEKLENRKQELAELKKDIELAVKEAENTSEETDQEDTSSEA